MIQVQITPKAFANSSPGFEEREPWDHHIKGVLTPEGVRLTTNPFSVVRVFIIAPRVIAGAPTLGSN